MMNLDNWTDNQLKNKKNSLRKRLRSINKVLRRIKAFLGDIEVEIEKRELERKIQCIK